jgi:GT2 family glycosyltransferase
MPVKIMLAVPTLNRLDRLTEMLASVAASTRQPDRVLIVNNGKQVTDTIAAEWSRQFELDIFTPQHNLGVAGSVNFAWRNTPDGWFWLHANDDVVLDTRCIELMVAGAENKISYPEHLTEPFIVPEHGEGSAFTVFMIKGSLSARLGYFDEQFFPAYAEDNDLGRRMNLIGVTRLIIPGAAYFHHVSSTLKAYTPEQEIIHHDQFRANVARYIAKWGGEMDKSERFTIPYDGARGHTLANAHLWHKEWL